MKAICTKRKWKFSPNATASQLLQVLFDNGLIPMFWQTHFGALRSTAEAGVPTARNKLGGHGQGVTIVEVPDYVASYVIHMTGSAMVFLAAAQRELNRQVAHLNSAHRKPNENSGPPFVRNA